jgi:hypothetical protein
MGEILFTQAKINTINSKELYFSPKKAIFAMYLNRAFSKALLISAVNKPIFVIRPLT